MTPLEDTSTSLFRENLHFERAASKTYGVDFDKKRALGFYDGLEALKMYCIFALVSMGVYILMVIMPAQFDKFMQRKGNFSSFAGVIKSIGFNWWAIPAMILGTIICGAIGGFIEKKLLRKHFKKTGIV